MNLGYQPTQKERFIDDLCDYKRYNKKFLVEALIDACVIDDDGNLEPYLIRELQKTKYLKQLIEFGEEILVEKENKLKSAMLCNHANECPNLCPCKDDCCCKSNMCRKE